MNWKSRQVTRWLILLNGLFLVVWVNMLADTWPVRVDLTEEGRYSISAPTKELLKNLDEVVYVEVYLEGELPSNLKRLQKSIRETLEEFSVYGGKNLEFTFKNPVAGGSRQAQEKMMMELSAKGIQPTDLSYTKDGNTVRRRLYPGALISYGGREAGVMLLKGNKGDGNEELLNQSIEGVEYNLAYAIKQLVNNDRKRVGVVVDHYSIDTLALAGFQSLLMEKYEVSAIQLARQVQPLAGFDAIVVAKPSVEFSENEKYLLDQYVMSGGKLLFFIDALSVDMAGAEGAGTIAFPIEHNLTDLLFNYGARINQDFVQDLSCGEFLVIDGMVGDQPQVKLIPWPFFPEVNRFSAHPMVKNLDAVIFRFTSTIDTVKADGIVKTPLMFTSERSRVLSSPVRVNLNDIRGGINPEAFNQGSQPVAYLLEGPFNSLYRNRALPRGVNKTGFREKGVPSKIVVVADGDFIRNELNPENGQPMELGIDPISQKVYANKDFIVNALEYLMDDDGLILARNREVKIRPLDKQKIDENHTFWQVLNLAGPLVLLLLFGIAKMFLRKRKYTRF
ncbi:MAG: gliding motility-associated ABC transporter substrate-binding protein GldG [Imperialibacter sp.]|uniref:gliding motility-associated ABC transporter substrate-binding protein GldG n=1 Tax=Imperialibacter sp. TaxID=2038411 RepID=UPI003A84A023